MMHYARFAIGCWQKESPHEAGSRTSVDKFANCGDSAGLIGGDRDRVRWMKGPICKDACADGETYEKRKPYRSVIPNGLRITAFCTFSSVQLLACHRDFPSFPNVRLGIAAWFV